MAKFLDDCNAKAEADNSIDEVVNTLVDYKDLDELTFNLADELGIEILDEF